MPTYLYRAKKGPIQVLEGQIEASTKDKALTKIDSLGLYLLWIEEKSSSSKLPSKVSLKELVGFTHQLSTLINSGSSLSASLDTLISQTEQAKFKPVISDIASQVKDGQDFSRALEEHPNIFSQLYTSLVRIGETSGTLGENLKRITDFLEEELDIRADIVSIATYPFLILLVGISTVLILLKFVIPKLVNVFEEIGQVLPLPTLFLIKLSAIFSKYGLLILVLILLLFFTSRKYFNYPHVRFKWDRFKLKIPLIGEVLKKIEICRLTRTLSLLLRNTVPIDAALKILVFTIPNLFIRGEIFKLNKEIKEGFSLSEAMKKIGIFSPSFINVVTVGENTGRLDVVLEGLSGDYTKELNRQIKRLFSLLEPFLILGVGAVIGFVVLAMLLPVFQIDFNF